MATVWQSEPLCPLRSGGCGGILRGAQLDSGTQWLTNNQVCRCGCVRNAALQSNWMAGEAFSSDCGRQVRGPKQRQEQEKEVLWRQFLLDPAMWWDNRRGKKSSRSPDFTRKGAREVLWLDNMFKPAWVDNQLVSSDMQMRYGASRLKFSSPECSRRAGSEMGVVTAVTVSMLCQQGKLTEAVGALECLAHANGLVSESLLYTVLKLCACKKDLVAGRRVHHLTVKLGYESSAYLGNNIVRMYACGGRLEEAMDVFTRVEKPNAFLWCSIISAHAKHGKPRDAIQLYHQMRRSGVKADAHVYVAALQACALAADLESGREVHYHVLHSGVSQNLFVGNCLVDMYAKCGELEDACRVFDSLATKDVVTWTSLIAGYANHGLGHEALVLYDQMEQDGFIVGNHITYACLLKACASTGALQKGRELHSQVAARGLLDSMLVGNCLVDMYAKCGEVEDARTVFDNLATKDVVTWNALIAGYAQQGLGQEALSLYGQMQKEGLVVESCVTFACLLKACASAGALQKGRQLHSHIVERGQLDNIIVGNSLVDMYAKCGELEAARQVFDSLTTKDVVTWNTLIAGYAQLGLDQQALLLYDQMQQEGLVAGNHVTFACLLKAIASAGAIRKGRQLHSHIVERGQQDNILVGNCLVDMYVKCGQMEDARQVFDHLGTRDVVTWTAMIAGYASHGLGQEALLLYAQMEQEGFVVGNHVTFACLLKACASAGALQMGRQLHLQIVARGGQLDDILVGNCLVDMYAKCGEVEEARRVFDSLATKDVVTWNSMISGYVQQGLGQEALFLSEQMEQEGQIVGNDFTFACLLKACASSGSLQMGKQLHSRIVERGQLDNVIVGNCLVDMYAKCGELEDARRVFDSLTTKDVVTWNALIAGCGTCDEGDHALACFEEMLNAGIQPSDATFTCLLAACSHSGLVNEGRKHFDSMVERGIRPTIEHYNCMIDLFGRAGYLDEAENMLLLCESQGNVVGLTSLLNSCRRHGDVLRATRCFESLIRLEPQDASAYVLMAHAYADAGRWTDAGRIEKQRMVVGAIKKPAVAGIEVEKQVHTFVVGENRGDIAFKVESVNARLTQEGGHVPHTKLVLKPLSEKEKEDALCGHAEKLALAFGLLNTPSGTPLVVTKNLRMCSDCHSSTAILSRVEQRDIVVRDGFRVHRFAAGSCSCKGRP